jgi:hypothetical protein
MGVSWPPAVLYLLFLYTSPTILMKNIAPGAFNQPKLLVSPPFGMTRWVAQIQIQYVSPTPYNASWAIEGAKEVRGVLILNGIYVY